MKRFTFLLFMTFVFFNLSLVYSAEQPQEYDQELDITLTAVKREIPHLINKRFPDLPTSEDFTRLNAALFIDWNLPRPLVQFHLTLGNLVFGQLDIPTAHSQSLDGKYHSDLYDLIREGHHAKIPLTWVPFCKDHETYVCIELRTENVCRFSSKFSGRVTTFSTWLKETFALKSLIN